MAAFTSPLAESLAEDVLARFLRYVRIDTRSALDRRQSPSTPGQLDLSRLLVDELREAGLADAALDANGYVFATLPGTGPAIGLIAHVDTSPEVSGTGVEPIVHRAYDGGRIELPKAGVVLDPADLPALAAKAGEDVVTASGDTLLGADDKAGVAAIVAAVAHLAAHPELPRPTLRVGFTPDEEIGEGATLFDVEAFGAQCAYTVDGSALGELQDETFTGSEVIVTIAGVDVHPGFATGTLVSAAKLAGRVLAALPADRLAPEATSGREGFIHPIAVGSPSTSRCCGARWRTSSAPSRAPASSSRSARSTRTCACTSSRSPTSSRGPSAPCAPRGSSRSARRSAAGRTGRSSAPRACRRPTCSRAATSSTRRASG
jgi:tripeptide aminopeptidase